MPKAVDIVLLPPPEVTNACIELNQQLKNGNSRSIELNDTDCLPHLSLCMGVLDEGELASAKKILQEISLHAPSFVVELASLGSRAAFDGALISSLNAKENTKLQALHNIIMTKFSSLLTHNAKPTHFIGKVGSSEVEWVNTYHEKNAFEHFWPHITIGYGKTKLEKPLSFNATRLALCHMGKSCTCVEVLCEVKLTV